MRSPIRLHAAALVFFCGASACFGEPDYDGRLCESGNICPAGYTCGADGRCHRGSVSEEKDAALPEASVEEDAMAELDAAEPADAGIAIDASMNDAGGPDESRCETTPQYSLGAWEARFHKLTAANNFAECVGVEDISGNIDRNYEAGGPAENLVDRFGTEYRRRIRFDRGVHTFRLTHDDGIRVFIDENLIYEDWRSGIVVLEEDILSPYLDGEADVRVEHYEDLGLARIHLEILRGCVAVDSPGTGWNVAYFRADNLVIDESECFGVEYLATEEFSANYGTGAPALVAARGVVDGWAAIAHGRRNLFGLTQFEYSHDDSLRLTIDQTVIYDEAVPTPLESGFVYATGDRNFEIRWVDINQGANAQVSWTNACDLPFAATDTTWIARYYSVNYDGTVNPPQWTLNRADCRYIESINTPGLSLDWMGGAPAYLMTAYGMVDLFGAEFIGPRVFASNTQVSMTHDDGLRVYVDGTSVYDNWTAPQVVSGAMLTLSGSRSLRLEYFENLGGAQLHFNY
jgi:hypothetical protein